MAVLQMRPLNFSLYRLKHQGQHAEIDLSKHHHGTSVVGGLSRSEASVRVIWCQFRLFTNRYPMSRRRMIAFLVSWVIAHQAIMIFLAFPCGWGILSRLALRVSSLEKQHLKETPETHK
jgi:hypothetical protein